MYQNINYTNHTRIYIKTKHLRNNGYNYELFPHSTCRVTADHLS